MCSFVFFTATRLTLLIDKKDCKQDKTRQKNNATETCYLVSAVDGETLSAPSFAREFAILLAAILTLMRANITGRDQLLDLLKIIVDLPIPINGNFILDFTRYGDWHEL